MKIIIAPDSFKHCLAAEEVARRLADGWRRARPDDELVCLPLADGGEGFTRTLTRLLGGTVAGFDTVDALGRPVRAAYGCCGGCGVVEMAAAAGIELLREEERDACRASTYGFGLLLRHLTGLFPAVIVGIGSSATTDGGAGCAQAFGWKFFTPSGELLAPGLGGGALGRIARVETAPPPACRIQVACDVDNPLTGPRGSARIFAAQKGAAPAEIELLDANLSHYAGELLRLGAAGEGTAPGDGAAGGLGYWLRHGLKAELRPGAELLLDAADFDRQLRGADLVITGEGRSDAQTSEGKLPVRVAERARRAGVPTLLVSGALADDEALRTHFLACLSIAAGPGPLPEALKAAPANLERTAWAAARLFSEKKAEN